MNYSIDKVPALITSIGSILTVFGMFISKYYPDFFSFFKKRKYSNLHNLNEATKNLNLDSDIKNAIDTEIDEEVFFIFSGIRINRKSIKKLIKLRDKASIHKWETIKNSINFINFKGDEAVIDIKQIDKWIYFSTMGISIVLIVFMISLMFLIDKTFTLNEKIILVVLYTVVIIVFFRLFKSTLKILDAYFIKSKLSTKDKPSSNKNKSNSN